VIPPWFEVKKKRGGIFLDQVKKRIYLVGSRYWLKREIRKATAKRFRASAV
jgi:hypothetical protein